MSWFDSIVDTGTKAFQWMEDNPNATSFIGGAAMGALKYADIRSQQKEREKDREFQRQLRKEDREYRSTFGGASTTEAGFEPANLTGGEGSLVGGTGVASMADQF